MGPIHPLRSLSLRHEAELIKIGTSQKTGCSIILLPNGRPWGTRAHAEEICDAFPRAIRNLVSICDEPAVHPLAIKYYVEKCDRVVSVEGGLNHLAFLLGKDTVMIWTAGAGAPKWIPRGSKLRVAGILEV